jgi:hypothetical protein
MSEEATLTEGQLKGFSEDNHWWHRSNAKFTVFQVIEGKARGIMKTRGTAVFIRNDFYVGYGTVVGPNTSKPSANSL